MAIRPLAFSHGVDDPATQRAIRQLEQLIQQAQTTATTTVELFTATTPGTVPASGGGTVNFLRADGTWANPTTASGVPTSRQVLAGTGLTGGGPLIADVTLNLGNTAVTPGTYSLPTLTVDAQGRITACSSGSTPSSTIPVFNVKDYGATGNGSTDDRASIQSAIAAAAAAGGGVVYFPAGTYIVGRNSTNPYCLDITGDNITFLGVRGASVIKAAAGMPASSVAVIRANEHSYIGFSGITVDGNWGNVATYIASSSHNVALPTTTINVASTAGFPSSGTVVVETSAGLQSVTYTGTTSTSFTGCSGGTGTMIGAQSYYWKGGVVGYLDSQAGINHGTQSDPKNYGILIRGCTYVTVDNCIVQNTYGDAIWLGQGATNFALWTENVSITRTKIRMTARDGIAIGQKVVRCHVDQCEVEWQYTQALDTEPVGVGDCAREITATNSYFGNWWAKANGSRNQNISVTISGGQSSDVGSPLDWAQNYRFVNNTVIGPIQVLNASDVVIANNRVICDWAGNAFPCIVVEFTNEDISIVDNYCYYRCNGFQGGINVQFSGIGSNGFAPRTCTVRGNKVHVRNGATGITIAGSGVEFSGVEVASTTGTATSVSGTTVTATASWTADQFKGCQVTMGGSYGTISTNSSNTFTVTAWQSPLGEAALTPAAGTFTILSTSGHIEVSGNFVDCTNDGRGQGGVGIEINAGGSGTANAGTRVSVHDNAIRNAAPDAIRIDATFRASHLIEVCRNKGFSADGTATTNMINFVGNLANIGKLVMDENIPEGNIVPLTGLSSGVWLLNDGQVQRWTGYGVPNGVISGRVGSTFHRRDDGAAAALWVKQTNESSNTGWVRLTAPPSRPWTVDDGSGIACPANTTEWTNFLSSIGLSGTVGTPSAVWNCQEASGDLVDPVSGLNLVATGTGLQYAQTISAWARSAVKTTDNANHSWSCTSASLPDVSVSSITLLVFALSITQAVPSVNRSVAVLGTGGTTSQLSYIGGAASTRVTSGTNNITGVGTNWGAVQPYVLRHDPGSSQTTGFDRTQKLIPTFASSVTGKAVALGGISGVVAPPTAYYLYAVAWFGSISDANLKTILKAMGWTIDWT